MKTWRIACPVVAALLAATTTLPAKEAQTFDVGVAPDGARSMERGIDDDGSMDRRVDLTDQVSEAQAKPMQLSMGSGEEGVDRATTTAADDDDLLECEGAGLIHVVPDECMHDGGLSAGGDSLEVYCHEGVARFCLSGEDCPWREAPASGGDRTCSRAGLETEWMASAWCKGWSDFDSFACTAGGKIELERKR